MRNLRSKIALYTLDIDTGILDPNFAMVTQDLFRQSSVRENHESANCSHLHPCLIENFQIRSLPRNSQFDFQKASEYVCPVQHCVAYTDHYKSLDWNRFPLFLVFPSSLMP